MWVRRLVIFCVAIVAMGTVVLVFNLVLFGAQTPNDEGDSLTPKTDAEFYVVRNGDALSLIEQRTGIEKERIEQLNPKIDPLALLPGERIRLRPPNARELAARRARARRRKPKLKYYTLKKGDVLSDVARKNGVDLIQVLELNPQIERPDNVYPGRRIQLR